jgi:TonB family protein
VALKESAMLKPRNTAAARKIAAVLSCLLLSALAVYAQTSGREVPAATPDNTARGIQLYQKKQDREAVEALRTAVKQKKDDVDAWYYLGLALYRSGETKEALSAFETAVKLRPKDAAARSNLAYALLSLDRRNEAKQQAERTLKLNPQSAEAHYVMGAVCFLKGERDKALEEAEAALRLNAHYPPALLLKTRSLIDAYAIEGYSFNEETRAARKSQLREMADELEQYLKSAPPEQEAKIWREQLENLRFYLGIGEMTKSSPSPLANILAPGEVTTKARMLARPAPQYPGDTRERKITGTVVLRAVLASDGRVRHIRVVVAPDKELAQASVDAARQIKFIPAMRDGKPVSQFVQIEYNFNIY